MLIKLLILSLVGLATAAQAAPSSQDPCHETEIQYCKGTTFANGETVKCLHEYEDKISYSCWNFLRYAAARRRALPVECREEIVKLCGHVKVGEGLLKDCTDEKAGKFSKICIEKGQEFVKSYAAEQAKAKSIPKITAKSKKTVAPAAPPAAAAPTPAAAKPASPAVTPSKTGP